MKNILHILCLFIIGFTNNSFSAANAPVSEKDATFINDLTRSKLSKPYNMRVEARVMYGNTRFYLRPMLLLPLAQSPDKLTYFNFIAMMDSKPNFEGNIGFGNRWLKGKYILGGFIHYDARYTKNNTYVQQVTAGFEYFEKNIEYRINLYIPLQDKEFVNYTVGATGNFSNSTNTTTYESFRDKNFDVTRAGFDFEFGGQMPQHTPFSIYLRGFYFHHSTFQKIYGVQFRTDYLVRDWLSLKASYTFDNSSEDNHYFVGLNFIWQAESKSYKLDLDRLSRKMVSMPIRDLDIYTTFEILDRQDLVTKEIAGRGVLIADDGVVVSGQDAFNTIEEANVSLVKQGVRASHVTVPEQDGNFKYTTTINTDETMTNKQMEAIRLSDMSFRAIDIKGQLFTDAVNNNSDDRGEIIKLREKAKAPANSDELLKPAREGQAQAEAASAKAQADATTSKATADAEELRRQQAEARIAAIEAALNARLADIMQQHESRMSEYNGPNRVVGTVADATGGRTFLQQRIDIAQLRQLYIDAGGDADADLAATPIADP